MSFVTDCPICRKAVTVTSELVGRLVVCPHCVQRFSVAAQGAQPIPIATRQSFTEVGSLPVRFTFTCQRCGSVLESNRDLCGQAGSCPTCGAVFTVPRIDVSTGMAAGPAAVADDGQHPTPMHAYATAGGKAPEIRRLPSGDQVIICPRCGNQMAIDANTCSSCGIPFTMEGAAAVAQVGPNSNGLATAALTVGILSIVSFCFPILGPVAIGLGIGGLYRAGKMGSGESGRKLAWAGIICGLASIGLFGLFTLGNLI